MKKIYVIMDGGVIQNIIGIPEDHEVIVRDFDMDFDDAEAFEAYAENGQLRKVGSELCTEIVWDYNPYNQHVKESEPATLEDAGITNDAHEEMDSILESQERDSIDNPNGDGT